VAAFDIRAPLRPTVLLALGLMAVIAMMVLPVPAWLLDIGLALSFAIAILIFTITLFIERPLDFSSFPTILLASLMLRLALNVSSTKLIIGEGHNGTHAAGAVIEGFASFIMGGSVLIGVVIFCVLLIVNFIVITKGAGRMAEVAARFALDGMPGRQLAIDSDMSAGAIDHAEAKLRRERELAETNFYGSLDGASKFVKGDAVAGLLITLLNIVMGLVIGIMVHDMPVGLAFETYAILTVGDGLVSQIPAVIISIAAALLLARGGTTGATDTALFGQLGRYPAALGTVAALMAGFALIPGLPFGPFMAGAAMLGGTAAMLAAAAQRRERAAGTPPAPEAPRQRPIGDILDVDEIHIEFAPDLVPMVLDPATGLDARISNIRNHIASAFGIILPEIRLTDEPFLPQGSYVVRIHGAEQARARLRPGRVLMLLGEGAGGDAPSGEDVAEPVFGAPARWIDPVRQEDAALAGMTVVSPTEVLATHLLEVLKGNLARLLTLKGLRRLLDESAQLSDPARAAANRRLLDELIPEKVPIDTLLGVLRLLLEEQVSVRNLGLILEAIAEMRGGHLAPEAICEHVRRRIGFQLIADLRRADGTVPLLQLAPEWEEIFGRHTLEAVQGIADVALPPEQFNRLASAVGERVARAAETGTRVALVTSAMRRRFVRTVLGARGVVAPVLSYDEIGTDARPALVGVVPA
jgi:flagellar biosynthesis protein FlhA